MSSKVHPTNWRCPDCDEKHSKPHWPDYHQKEPGWKEKLDKHGFDKGSDPAFEFVCEICGHELIQKPVVDGEPLIDDWCSKCKKHKKKDANYCSECGTRLGLEPRKHNWCSDCEAERQGIPAPLLCPHCAWTQSRIVLVKT